MVEDRSHRRLAAILAADVVGYSRLMQQDEAGTLAILKSRRSDILRPAVLKHRGRIVKFMGDGVLVEFASVVDAVDCAVQLQNAMHAANADLPAERRIVLRIGINVGDVMVEGSDIYGDGVNIAARIEGVAEPGSICISEAVFKYVRGRASVVFEDLGERSLKSIAEPVRVYRVAGVAPSTSLPTSGTGIKPQKPSIVVLPFTNMSGDPEQAYFSDGITEDIITDLSQVSALHVISRNTAFTFKNQAVDVIAAARNLHVAYALEGSVRKSGSRLRITAQLIDVATGGHLWAERYDREFGDVFALQDEIARHVVSALKVKLLPQELETISRRATFNTDAYECYLQARSIFMARSGSKRTIASARDLFSKAVKMDPGYARAYAGIADCDSFLWLLGDPRITYEQILEHSGKAIELTPKLAEAHASRGLALSMGGRFEEASAAFEQAVGLDPDLFEAFLYFGQACRMSGQLDKAVELLQRAAELGPDAWLPVADLLQVLITRGERKKGRSIAEQWLLPRLEAELQKHPDNGEAAAIRLCGISNTLSRNHPEWHIGSWG